MQAVKSERRPKTEKNETPADVASLYSWANLHGAKYRDFSASRAQSREKARLRVQQAIEEERSRVRVVSERQLQEEEIRAVSASAPVMAGQKGEMTLNGMTAEAENIGAESASSASPQALPVAPEAPKVRSTVASAFSVVSVPRSAQATENLPPSFKNVEESGSLPAFLTGDSAAIAMPPEDALQGSRDHLAARWFALRGSMAGAAAATDFAPVPAAWRAPVLAVFSLAGGVGKTCLAATLGRALSARGEKILLVDTSSYALLPFYFGSRDQRSGVLRTFMPPGGSEDAPLQMLAIESESSEPENASQELLSQQVFRYAGGVGRVIVDLATASGATMREILRLSPMVLVPVVPDLNSVVSVSSIDAFFRRNSSAAGSVTPYYVLNQFDASLPLHLDAREVLREQLGDRLLPLVLRRSPSVSEALAEGMTVMDYAPNSPAAEDFGRLAGWVRTQTAPACASYPGVRWSER